MPPLTPARSAPERFPWPAPFKEAGLLLLIAVIVAAASWYLRPDGLPLVADPVGYELELDAPLVPVDRALVLYDDGDYIFVDTRSRMNGDFRTIPGAFFIRDGSFDNDLLEYFDFMTTEDHFVLFGDGNLLAVSNIAARMKERGYTNLLILKGGLPAWIEAGGDVSRRTGGDS